MALTYDGRLVTEGGQAVLGQGKERLATLFITGHEVITELRQMSEKTMA